MKSELVKKIKKDISSSTIPEMLKILYLMANATEIMSQQSFQRIKAVFAKHGLKTQENELLTGINQYCKFVKSASYQFFAKIDPQIINATFGTDGNASALDGFNEDANELCRLILLYFDRTAQNNDGYAKVFKTLRQLPSSGLIKDEDIARFKVQ